MPRMRKKMTENFTVLNNGIFQDMNLKGIDRGILCTMLSLSDNWNFSIKGLTKIIPDGETAIANSLKRLEKACYLIRKRIYEDGKIVDWEYIISDKPMTEAKTENTGSQNSSKQERECLDDEKLDVENQDVGSQNLGNPNDNKESKYKISKDKISSDKESINLHASKPKKSESNEGAMDAMDWKKTQKEVAKQINLPYLSEVKKFNGQKAYSNSLLEELTELIVWTYCTTEKTIRINRTEIPTEVVRRVYRKLDETHIKYALDCLKDSTTRIANRRSYLQTTLYNAVTSIDGYYDNLAQSKKQRAKQTVPRSENAAAYESFIYNIEGGGV